MATAMAPLTRNLIAQCVQQRNVRLFNCPPVVTQFSPHQSYAMPHLPWSSTSL